MGKGSCYSQPCRFLTGAPSCETLVRGGAPEDVDLNAVLKSHRQEPARNTVHRSLRA